MKAQMLTNSQKIYALERTNGDLKKKVGTMALTFSKMQESHDKLVELMKELVAKHKNTNAKLHLLYENRYGDVNPASVPLSGITVETDALHKDNAAQQ